MEIQPIVNFLTPNQDLKTWKTGPAPMHLYGNSFSQGLAYGKGYWVAYISDPFSQEGKLFRSTGGLVPSGWETVASFEIDLDAGPFMNNLVFHGDNFVAAGAEYFLVSNDGQTGKMYQKMQAEEVEFVLLFM